MIKKPFLLLCALALAALVGWQVYERVSSPSQAARGRPGNAATPVEVAPVRRIALADVGSFGGTLSPRSKYILAPKVAGRLEKLHVNMGDRVERGQVLAVLDDDEYVQQVDQARAELEVARASLVESRSALDITGREFERVRSLRQKGIASQSELDEKEAKLNAQSARHKVAQAQVAQKEAALKAAQVRLSYTQIRASWEETNGSRVVGERFVDEGAMLSPSSPILSVLDIAALTGVIHVIEKDYAKLKIGQEATAATDAFPGRTFSGRILRVAPLLKEASRQARVEIEIPNPDGLLKPGMFVRVQIEFARYPDAQVVPRGAVVKKNGQEGVFVADAEARLARFVPVTLGIVNEQWAQILEPQAIPGPVVTMGQHLLEDGSPVILAAPPPAGGPPGTDPGRPAGQREKPGQGHGREAAPLRRPPPGVHGHGGRSSSSSWAGFRCPACPST